MKTRKFFMTFILVVTSFLMMSPQSAFAESSSGNGKIPDEVKTRIQSEIADSLATMLSVNLFEKEMDEVVFATNDFLTDATFTGNSGPFWYVLQMSICLAALFSIIVAAGMAYKMMVKHETFDVMKILKIFGISVVLAFWYPNSHSNNIGWSVLDYLSYIPNCIGSWTADMYEAEAAQVEIKYKELVPLMKELSARVNAEKAAKTTIAENLGKANSETTKDTQSISKEQDTKIAAQYEEAKANYASLIVFFDKLLMFLAFIIYRIGWWATIYCQQIMLGMLTIFGPIQWAFSVLPKWEGAWAKWISRYLTVHFYGAMLYFVGYFYNLTHSISVILH
ncbi:MAG: hypothetical protein ACI3ZD_08840, partial [Prevotella sp.]